MSDAPVVYVDPSQKIGLKDVYTLYENGKSRRYGLLFSVNGAALAILSFFAKDAEHNVLAGLFALGVAGLMIMFTWTMKTDIYSFGTKMARAGESLELFGEIGQRVLRRLTSLLIAAWIGIVLFGIGLLVQ